jgi:hypothetical protein
MNTVDNGLSGTTSRHVARVHQGTRRSMLMRRRCGIARLKVHVVIVIIVVVMRSGRL